MTISGSTLYEQLHIATSIAPDTYGAGTTNGADVPTQGYRKALVTLATKVMAASSTLNVKIQYKDASGSYVDLVGEDGSTVVAFAEQGEDDDNVTLVGEINLTEIPEHTDIRAVGVVATAAAEYSVGITLGDQYEAPSTMVNRFGAIIGIGAR